MKTTMENAGQVQRKWYIIDATGKSVGRVAAQAASILRGKVKPTFTPNVDCGDGVIIINCAQAIFTGNKMEQKYYYRHTGYIGTWFSDPVFEGKTDHGEDVLVTGQIVENPYPEKKISEISYKASENDISRVVLCGIKGLNPKA